MKNTTDIKKAYQIGFEKSAVVVDTFVAVPVSGLVSQSKLDAFAGSGFAEVRSATVPGDIKAYLL